MHHITHIKNLENILKSGRLIARNFLKDDFIDTANSDIIEKRKEVDGKDLNDYVPFHNDNLQMNYNIPYNYEVCKKNGKSNMVYIVFNPFSTTLAPWNECLFYAYHPASKFKIECFHLGELDIKLKEEFKKLPRTINNKIDFAEEKVKKYLMSEILIKESVSLRYVDRIYVYNKDVLKKVKSLLEIYHYNDIEVEVKPSFYTRYC